MGNSGSVHNIAPGIHEIEEQRYNYDHHINKNLTKLDSDSCIWNENNFHHNINQIQKAKQLPHIKVLPDCNEVSKLRTTTNGAILHSGGTISGRRDQISLPTLQRSKTSLNYDLSKININEPVNRNSIPNLQKDYLAQSFGSFKKFGSEPDLRVSDDECDNSQKVQNQRNNNKTNLIKSKKKKSAPPPPPVLENSQNNFYNTKESYGDCQQKKIRLFKTKAESRKISLAEDEYESMIKGINSSFDSDKDFKKNLSNSTNLNTLPPKRISNIQTDLSLDRKNWKESRIKVLPLPTFRREKTFDITLLRHKEENQNETKTKLQREHQRSLQQPSISLLQQQQQNIKTKQTFEKDKQLTKRAEIENKAVLKKISSLPFARNKDFKKELEQATKRLSVAKQNSQQLKQINSIENCSKETNKIDRPIPKARLSKTRINNDEKISNSIRKTSDPQKIKEVDIKTNNIRKISDEIKSSGLTKTFYFGMEKPKTVIKTKINDDNFGKTQLEVIDQFAKILMTTDNKEKIAYESSESALSSEDGYPMPEINEIFEEGNDSGIQVYMRPTLPRRQLEIPRFSPAAAWRMLNEEQKNLTILKGNIMSTYTNNDNYDIKKPLEEKIQKIYRDPAPLYPDNKSGDSGISGDGVLPERPESPQQNSNNNKINIHKKINGDDNLNKIGPFLTTWTPQQDLEDDDDDESSSNGDDISLNDLRKISNQSHIFSLSLPREGYIPPSYEQEKLGFNSLQKLKQATSVPLSSNMYQNDNWLLSRSAPNSIDNSQTSSSLQHINNEKENIDYNLGIQPSSFVYLTSGKHVMYLPNTSIEEALNFDSFDKRTMKSNQNFNLEKNQQTFNGSYNKNCLNNNLQQDYIVESLESKQDINKIELNNNLSTSLQINDIMSKTKLQKSRGRRFTFQSTVRQIERRRLAERLSKEAEEKEAQRLSELEAMKRVEEEFQRKRAREKAKIRQQLRLYSLEDSGNTSRLQRDDPDGASPSSSPTGKNSRINETFNKHFINTQIIIGKRTNSLKQTSLEIKNLPAEPVHMAPQFLRLDNSKLLNSEKNNKKLISKIPTSKSNNMNHIFETSGNINLNKDTNQSPLNNYRREFVKGRFICGSDSEQSSLSCSGMVAEKYKIRSRYEDKTH